MTTAGIYNVTAGRAEIRPDGSITFHSLRLKPAPMPDTDKPLTLQERWNNESGLTWEKFKSELIRINDLSENDNRLNLSGKQVRSLYRFLSTDKIIRPCADMVQVYKSFAGSFTMKFSGPGSLTRLKDFDEDLKYWRETFAFCVRDSNATRDSDGPLR